MKLVSRGCHWQLRELGMEGIVFTDYETGKKKLEQMLMAKSKED